MSKRTWAAAGGLAVAAVLVGGGVAFAGQGAGGPGERGSHDYTEQQSRTAVGAALEATGGGTAHSVERDGEDGATWEVEVTRTDGTTVDVRLDESFGVVVIEGDGEPTVDRG